MVKTPLQTTGNFPAKFARAGDMFDGYMKNRKKVYSAMVEGVVFTIAAVITFFFFLPYSFPLNLIPFAIAFYAGQKIGEFKLFDFIYKVWDGPTPLLVPGIEE